jgi:hypothetical protein
MLLPKNLSHNRSRALPTPRRLLHTRMQSSPDNHFRISWRCVPERNCHPRQPACQRFCVGIPIPPMPQLGGSSDCRAPAVCEPGAVFRQASMASAAITSSARRVATQPSGQGKRNEPDAHRWFSFGASRSWPVVDFPIVGSSPSAIGPLRCCTWFDSRVCSGFLRANRPLMVCVWHDILEVSFVLAAAR